MRGKRAIKNVILSVIMQITVMLCGFIVPKLIISEYGSEVNGLQSSITQFLGYIVLLESGIGPVIRASLYKPIAKKNIREIENILYTSEKFFKKIALIFIVYILLLCFVFPIFVNKSFNSTFTVSLIIIISISTFFEYYFGMTYRLFLRANQESYIISYVQIITSILNTLCVLILIKCDFSIQIVKLFSSLIFVLRPLIQYLYIKKKYKFCYKNVDKKFKLKQKWDGFSQHVAAVIHTNTDIVVLTIFSSLTDVSIYSVYALVIKGIKNLIDSLTNGIDSAFGDMIAKNEIDSLNKSFQKYETIYYAIIIVVFSCALFLITPFVAVYTRGISDANYVRYLFGYILVLAEYIYVIRLPYNTLVLSAGLFKEMRRGAWIETLSNIIISVILVYKFGLIGVAIGTLISMIYRTVEFIIIASRHILKRDYKTVFRKIIMIVFELILLYIVNTILTKYFNINSYTIWCLYAIIIFTFSVIFLVILERTIDYKECKNLVLFFKSKIKKYNI